MELCSTCILVLILVLMGCMAAWKKALIFVAALRFGIKNSFVKTLLEIILTAMRSPSTSSAKSRAALTRDRTLIDWSFCWNSSITGIQGSATGVSRIVVTSSGETLKSDSS